MTLDVSRLKALAILALAVFAAYGSSLNTKAFVYDDQYLIDKNPLLHEGVAGVVPILRTGYWEAPDGRGARVQEYRPLLMLSFLAQIIASGFSARMMRLGNILLHLLVCWLLWEILRRKIGPQAAIGGALIYAVMPIHAEAVGLLTGRSEVLSAALLLSSWMALETETAGSLILGLFLYACSIFTKESCIMFPVFIALNDWTFSGRKPWQGWSRASQTGLWVMTAAALAARCLILSAPFHGGMPYFHAGWLVVALSFAKFSLAHYLRPSLTGMRLCVDYSRPLIPDSSLISPIAWMALFTWAAFFLFAAWSLVRKRSRWAFWALAPAIFLLPTSNLILPLDTLGAERFLYWPTISLAAGWGYLYWKTEKLSPKIARIGLAALCVGYGFLLARRNRIWNSSLDFDRAEVACNPVSAKGWSALGGSLIQTGALAQGVADLKRAAELDPVSSAPYYNMARLEFSRNKIDKAEFFLEQTLRRDPQSSDAWVLLGLCAQKQNNLPGAREDFEKAARINPNLAAPYYNLARLEFSLGHITQAQELLRKVLRGDSRSADYWTLLGLCAEKQKNMAGALADFKTAANLGPQNALAQFNAGRLCLLYSDFPCVKARWSAFLLLAPNDAQAPAVRNWLAHIKGKPQGNK